MKKFVFIAYLTFTATVYSNDYSYQYQGGGTSEFRNYEGLDYYPDNLETPKFLSTAQTFSVEVNDDITFPCDAEKTSSQLMMLFKHLYKPTGRERTLYVGQNRVNQNSRIRKVDSSFVLEGIRKRDAGQYICIFETEPYPIELRHTLNVQYSAKVERVGPDFQRVKQGSTVTLQCKADGNPTPAITWTKERGTLPRNIQSEKDDSITFEKVDRHAEGEYKCTASNGIGETSSANIKIEVEYMPEIKSQQDMIVTPNGYEAVLTCLVHGRPNPTLSWYRKESLVSSHRHIMTHDGSHRHTLTVTNVEEKDFGDYSCVAKNIHGEVAKKLTLTGFPRSPVITSNPNGGETNSYKLRWKTESLTPITVYRIRYRAVNENLNVNRRPIWHDTLFSTKEQKAVRDTHSSHNVKMEHIFDGLRASNDYQVTVRVENKFGWSKESKLFSFNTRKEWKISHLASTGQAIPTSLAFLLCIFIVFL